MRYDLTLRIEYDYGAAAPSARNVLRVAPRRIDGVQSVENVRLEISPDPAEIRHRVDFWGNSVAGMSFHEPLRKLTARLSARVERLARPPTLDLTPRRAGLASEIAARRGLGPDEPHHFRAPSPRVGPDPGIADFAETSVAPDMTVLGSVLALGRAIHGHMRFDAAATTVDTAPSEAFAARHGVCQDFTHVMIAGLRSLGIPAGYVSGYLRTTPPKGRPRLQGADAMHAWVRAWCGTEAGWVEYDPTNDLLVGVDHIVVAVGRDYSDVAPVKGSLRTSGRQMSKHSVDLVPLDS
ncbi:transglutaminase [Roseivivax halodurans JCM 10272]|uniref:Transglutaminase n=1 Tax=Roseivivax halodurans JCM 10272 TaxID=1449350 RepID=X7EHB8_9RHOB|nr:transglutaminase family protein [Roseivivax halodurans]ETX14601.1 transglutaminase [Roseivivax halodurans JCM 10272]